MKCDKILNLNYCAVNVCIFIRGILFLFNLKFH